MEKRTQGPFDYIKLKQRNFLIHLLLRMIKEVTNHPLIKLY